jgi:hypothetical protein
MGICSETDMYMQYAKGSYQLAAIEWIFFDHLYVEDIFGSWKKHGKHG